MSQVIDILRRARHIVSNPKRWNQGSMGRDSRGDPCNEDYSEAVSWCAAGAIWRNRSEAEHPDPAFAAAHKAARKLGYTCVTQLNDTTDQPTVLRMFDEAIKIHRLETAK